MSSEQSRNEIERTLRRYGAEDFAYASSKNRAMVGFTAKGRQVRFILPLPDPASGEFTLTPTGKARTSQSAIEEAYEQAVRQKWRALALMVKAKLEAVQSGIVSFEQEFLPHIVLPGGATVYESVRQGVEQSYSSGVVAPLLAIGPGQ